MKNKEFIIPELIIVYFNDDMTTDDPMTGSGPAGDDNGQDDEIIYP